MPVFSPQPTPTYGTTSWMSAFYAASTARTCTVTIYWYQADGSPSAITPSNTSPGLTDSTTQWLSVAASVVPPSDASQFRVGVEIASCAAGESHYVDETGVFPGAVTNWTRGGLVGATTAVLTRSDGAQVRGASAANPVQIPASTQQVVVYDAELTPTTDYTYTAVVDATASGFPIASPASLPTSAESVSTTKAWEFDPTDLSTAVAAQVTQWNPQVTEQSTAHLVAGQPTMNIVANAMGKTDGQATFETFDQPTYAGLEALLLSQKTIFVSLPYAESHYARFGPATGGLSAGVGNKTKDAQLQASTAAAPYRITTVSWVAQERPLV